MNTEKKGYSGLENIGNTCFINSCLQIMKEIKQLDSIFQIKSKNNLIKTNINGVLFCEWYNLNHIMKKTNGVIKPNRFIDILQKYAKDTNKVLFTGWAQNDIQEFFMLLIEGFHNSISTKKKIYIDGSPKNDIDKLAVKCFQQKSLEYKDCYSEINELFHGVSVTFIQGLKSRDTTYKPDLYSFISLPIIEGKTTCNNIYDCFKTYIKPELLDGDNKWLNDNKNIKEAAVKYVKFWDFPNVLFIMFKRFSPNLRNKINTVVDFPIDHLDLSPFVCGYKPHTYVYELFGVCNHSGGLMGGHYTAFVRNTYNEWLLYNDNNISKVSNLNDIVSAKAYCLFYRKK